MKVTFPHMGTIEILLKDLFTRLEVDYVSPPKTTNETLKIGVKYAPEFSCLPLKVTIGNLIEGLEAGADTIIMAGGYGPCRFGYYAQVQRRIIEDAGYRFKLVVVEPPGGGLRKFIGAFKRLSPQKSIRQIWKELKICFKKVRTLDLIEKKVLEVRAFEKNPGDTNKRYRKALRWIDRAFTEEEIVAAQKKALDFIGGVEKESEREKGTLKVGIVGEFYVLLEPFVNFDIQEYLGSQGVYLERGVYLSDWISPSTQNVVLGVKAAEIAKEASPYLSHGVGGEGQPTIGHTVKMAKEGFDGVIHLYPFTCMPETIAGSIFPRLSEDLGIPVLTLVIDEQTGKAGVITRLEAFLDLLHSKRRLGRRKLAGKLANH